MFRAMLRALSHPRHIGVRLVGAGLLVAAACKGSVSDEREKAVLTLEAAGESPTVVVRPAYHDGKLRIVARAGDVTQTRIHAMTVRAHKIDVKSTGVGMDLSPDSAEMSVTLGAHGEVVEPPRTSRAPFKSSADYGVYQRENNHDVQAARNELRWLFPPVPSEPIGVGARWRFEQDHESMVGPMHQVLQYVVVRRDASELELRVHVDATSNFGNKLHANGTVVLPLGTAGKLPRGTFEFSNENASGTLEMTPSE
jgi:hypothetical protein